jgi:membrane-bound lytic murein transglycosylase MltF
LLKSLAKRANCLVGALVAALCLLLFAGPAWAAADHDPSEEFVQKVNRPWTGDLPGMIERRNIRALVAYSKTNYFLDGPQERGITYELLKLYEKGLNQELEKRGKKKKNLQVHVIIIPVSRDQLIPLLLQGKGDIAAANLTVTSQRQKQVEFCAPFSNKVKELVVTSPGAPALKSLEDLAGRTVYVRKSSSYFTSLTKLNAAFKQKGLAPVKIDPADENLETEDILEMVNAGLVPITIADSHLAEFWGQIFKKIKIYQNLAVRSGGSIAWAVRKGSPKLAQSIDTFVKSHKQGTMMGNLLLKRYLQDTKWAKQAISEENIKRFDSTTKFFQKYAAEYGFDWLMLTALAFQESGLDHSKVSQVGAVGVMQILPKTAAGPPVSVAQYKNLEGNIHAGTKYLRWIYDQYFKDDPQVDHLNKVLFTFASSNAGPAKVIKLRRQATKMGLNPNIWFRNVEVVAAKVIGRETVQYVGNIYKYYVAYLQVLKQRQQREEAAKKK